jgi:RHS repeat-associated protein
VLERLAYDPFGKRRFANGSGDPGNTIRPLNTDRGYTGHEMLDDIGLVHMNGRVYDPLVGRFLSADPFIQSPYNLQSHNRYSYVMNNPLGYTDPSGYRSFSLRKHLNASFLHGLNPNPKTSFDFYYTRPWGGQFDNYVMNNKWAYMLGQMIATSATKKCWGCGGAAWAAYYTELSTGSRREAAKAGTIAFAMSFAFSHINGTTTTSGVDGGAAATTYNFSPAVRIVGSGVVGGIGAELQGGSFQRGFLMSAASTSMMVLYDTVTSRPGSQLEQSDGTYKPKDGVHTHSSGKHSEMGTALTSDMVYLYEYHGVPLSNMPGYWFSEASSVLRWISSHIPGFQGISRFHDTWLGALVDSGHGGSLSNVGTMLPSAAVVYGGALGNEMGQASVTYDYMRRNSTAK